MLFLTGERRRDDLADAILEKLGGDGILFERISNIVVDDCVVDFWRNFLNQLVYASLYGRTQQTKVLIYVDKRGANLSAFLLF